MTIPIYNKSNYSLLSSLLKIDDIILYAKKNNLPSISLTDNNMFGTMEFIHKCNKEGIKPVIGLELNLEDFNLVLYAKNYEGYKSLIKLSTIQSERVVTIASMSRSGSNLILSFLLLKISSARVQIQLRS